MYDTRPAVYVKISVNNLLVYVIVGIDLTKHVNDN